MWHELDLGDHLPSHPILEGASHLYKLIFLEVFLLRDLLQDDLIKVFLGLLIGLGILP